MRRLRRAATLCLAFASALTASPAIAQTAENVAVVINVNSAESQRIGEYYVAARGIPASNVIRIQTTTLEALDHPAFVVTIQQPIGAALGRERLHDRVLYLVLTKGVPLRIVGTVGAQGTTASVDSELTLLYRRMTGQSVVTRGRIDNPYFLGTRDITEAQRFTHRDHDIFLVSRLDGFTAEDAIGLVDRGKMPAAAGLIVLDQRDVSANRIGEEWLALAAKRLTVPNGGNPVLLETTAKAARTTEPVLGYYSWGSADPQNRVRKSGMSFVPGALAATFVSTDARTFREPPATWMPTENLGNRSTWFAASPQSLIGDLIRDGVTGVAGHVAEPFLQSAVRPEVLFPAYVAGFNLIEAFYLALPHLSWQTVVVGDPLASPFSRPPLTTDDIEAAVNVETELPGHFSKRRLAHAQTLQRGVSERSIVLSVRADSLMARNDLEGARTALEESTALAPRVVSTQTTLALLYEKAELHDQAIERYRRVLQLEPNDAVALNNLAYNLAVRKQAPAEALEFAKRAATLAPGSPAVLDTLGWVHHLLGNDLAAAPVMANAVRRSPGDADIRLHAAIVYAARGRREAAEAELKEAIRLNPDIEMRDEVATLRARLLELGAN